MEGSGDSRWVSLAKRAFASATVIRELIRLLSNQFATASVPINGLRDLDLEIQHALQQLPGADRPSPASQVGNLAELIDGDLPLQSFLELLLPQLCLLFGGSAAVAWLKAHGTSDAIFGVRYQMDKLLSSIEEQKKHEGLVQLAWQQKQPLLAESAATGTTTSYLMGSGANPEPLSVEGIGGASLVKGKASPSGYPLLFGPILHLGEPIALLEVALSGSADVAASPFTPAQRQLYLRSIKLVAERVYGGLRRRMAMPAARIDKAVEQVERLTAEVHALQQQISQRIELRLQQFHGWAFASLAENQAFAKLVHQMLDSHGLRVVCPECGHPAILRCLRVGNAKHGAFVFDHYLDSGRTFHGGPSTVPLIKVVGKPARRPALSNPA